MCTKLGWACRPENERALDRVPSARQWAVLNMVDNADLFVFGGRWSKLGTLWRYNISSKRWSKICLDLKDLLTPSFTRTSDDDDEENSVSLQWNKVACCCANTDDGHKNRLLTFLFPFCKDWETEGIYHLYQLQVPIGAGHHSGVSSSSSRVEQIEFEPEDQKNADKVISDLADSSGSFLFAVNECHYVSVPENFLLPSADDENVVGDDDENVGGCGGGGTISILKKESHSTRSNNCCAGAADDFAPMKWRCFRVQMKSNVLFDGRPASEEFVASVRGKMASGYSMFAFQFNNISTDGGGGGGGGNCSPCVGIVAQADDDGMAEDDEDMCRRKNQFDPPAGFCAGTDSQRFMVIFDVRTELFAIRSVCPDPVFGFPFCRDGAVPCVHGTKCFLVGGVWSNVYLKPGRKYRALDEIWQLDLATKLQWTKLDRKIPRPVFNANGQISDDGILYLFGGITTPDPTEGPAGDGDGNVGQNFCWLLEQQQDEEEEEEAGGANAMAGDVGQRSAGAILQKVQIF